MRIYDDAPKGPAAYCERQVNISHQTCLSPHQPGRCCGPPPSPPPEGRCSPDTGGATGRQSSALSPPQELPGWRELPRPRAPLPVQPAYQGCPTQGRKWRSPCPSSGSCKVILVQGTLWSQLGSSLRMYPAQFRPGPIPLLPFPSSAVGAQSSPSTNILHVAPPLELASQGTQASHFLWRTPMTLLLWDYAVSRAHVVILVMRG